MRQTVDTLRDGDTVLDPAGQELIVVLAMPSLKDGHTVLTLARTHSDTVQVVRMHNTETLETVDTWHKDMAEEDYSRYLTQVYTL